MMKETIQVINGENPTVMFNDTYKMHKELIYACMIDESGRSRIFRRYMKYFVNHGPCPLTGGDDRIYLSELIPGLVTAKMTYIEN